VASARDAKPKPTPGFDLVGFIGVLLIIIAYLLLQLDKLSSSPSYSLLIIPSLILISICQRLLSSHSGI
jgi:hypothetical protein